MKEQIIGTTDLKIYFIENLQTQQPAFTNSYLISELINT